MTTETTESSWFMKEKDWNLKRSIIFNKDLVRFTFLEVGRLINLLGGIKKKSKVLDLCCGIGRHSIEFARLGYLVTGVDITKSYLDLARENAEEQKLDINFIHNDMRDFCQPNSFDLVVNLCTSFGYFDDLEDDLKVLGNIYKSLKVNGRFVIEILGKEVIASTFKDRVELEFEGYKVTSESRILNDWSILECRRKIEKDGKEDEIIAYHRLYSAVELKNHLKNIGFKNIKVFGDFAGSVYNSKAKSMIMICDK